MIEITYEVHFKTPLHIGTGYGFAGFLDSVVVRDAQGHVYVPGSTIKGKARAAARRLAQGLKLGGPLCPPGIPCGLVRGASGTPHGLVRGAPCPVCRLFGSPQFPGQLYFDNVQLPDPYRKLFKEMMDQDRLVARRATTQRRTNVMLSRRRRAARPDHLFTNELVRADLPLSGRIRGEVIGREGADAAMLRDDLALLWGALQVVTHLGQARSRGLGHCAITVASLQVGGASFTEADYAAALRQLGGGVDQ